MFSKIQYISQGKTAIEQEKNINNVLKYGADWIQLRWKQGDEVQLLALAIRVQKKCIQYGATLIINDHIGIAKTIDADGVHLGLTDTSIQKARELLGPDKMIGGTANNLTDVKQRIVENCDYIGLGPLRFTTTKEKLSPILGLNGYQQIIQQLKNEVITYPPIYAIGGISQEDIIQLQEAGLYGVAVSSLLSEQPDLIQDLKNKLQQDLKNKLQWTI
ncbi:thiamine phosphate synthase [Sphingobacterium faecium]|uniref:thiamine phosphate synthase n=1 Tax=Sphingobacterium faecium TaxID=34087 RepID=UPI002468D1B1|nr:thiamine phosphate synthase [Sphingobacterium faecium]MDH5827498.1 thiamine phosphate synthase [Sphingobacterium faecium]